MVLPEHVDTWEVLNALNVSDIIILSLSEVRVINHGSFWECGVQVLQVTLLSRVEIHISLRFDSLVGVLAVDVVQLCERDVAE